MKVIKTVDFSDVILIFFNDSIYLENDQIMDSQSQIVFSAPPYIIIMYFYLIFLSTRWATSVII